MLPLYMLTIGLFAVGIGWIVASLHVFLRDTAQMLSVVLTFWFWMTPIFIDEDNFPAGVRFLLTANPLYYAVRILPHDAAALHRSRLAGPGGVGGLRYGRLSWWAGCSSAT